MKCRSCHHDISTLTKADGIVTLIHSEPRDALFCYCTHQEEEE